MEPIICNKDKFIITHGEKAYNGSIAHYSVEVRSYIRSRLGNGSYSIIELEDETVLLNIFGKLFGDTYIIRLSLIDADIEIINFKLDSIKQDLINMRDANANININNIDDENINILSDLDSKFEMTNTNITKCANFIDHISTDNKNELRSSIDNFKTQILNEMESMKYYLTVQLELERRMTTTRIDRMEQLIVSKLAELKVENINRLADDKIESILDDMELNVDVDLNQQPKKQVRPSFSDESNEY